MTGKIFFTAIALCLLGGTAFLTVALISPPAPGTIRNPDGYDNGTDFTAIY